jgi:CRISPR-associated protein Cmr2
MSEGKHLILIAVGPVQEFIAAARKLRDLWYGSTLLSDLSKSVAAALHAEGCKLIFPAPENARQDLADGSDLIVANKILAECPNGVGPEHVVAKARRAYREAWLARCCEAQAKFPPSFRLNAAHFQQQVDDFGEFYAVWVPLESDYQVARDKVEDLLAARKCTRCFEAPKWDGTGLKKSSLDGIREVVFDVPKGSRDLRVKTGEVLDAVGAVKRFGGKARRFETLAELAIIPWLEGARKIKDGELLKKAEYALRELLEECAGKMEGVPDWKSLLYPHELEALSQEADLEGQEDVRAALTPLYHALGEPSPYACYLLGDGDHMGGAIGSLDSIEKHQAFSRELSAFAEEADKIVSKYGGGLVYSGGDDVMACLPLHTALDCSDELRKEFAKDMVLACPEMEEKPTFSVGLAIVHHADDLGGIRKLASEAEGVAKDKAGRNALCVIQDKRSGGQLTVFGKWDRDKGHAGLVERLRLLMDLYQNQGLSSRLGYQLRMIARSCGEKLEWQSNGTPANAASAEALRVMRRKQTNEGDLSEDRVQEVLRMYENIRTLSDELVIARQLAQAAVLAEGKKLDVLEDE